MSSVGFGLINSLIQSGDRFSSLNDFGISEDHFIDNEVSAYSFTKSFILEHGQYPQVSTIARHIGDITAFDGLEDEPVSYWVEEVKERKRYSDIKNTLVHVRSQTEAGNISGAIDLLANSYINLRNSYTGQGIEDLRELEQRVLENHDTIQRSPDIPGIPFGFPFIDTLSGGAQRGDYIAIVGETGVGKTYLALKMAKTGFDAGHNILAISTEMPTLQAARRILAMEGRFSTTDLKMGRLSHFGRQRAQRIVEQGAASVEGSNWFYFLPGGMFSKVEDIIILAREMKPDLLVVDGAYLLQVKAASWWEKNMEVARQLKNLSLLEDIRTISTYQFLKKDTGKLEGVGGGFAIPQIASIVFSFEYERKEDRENNNEVQYRKLKFIKGRDGESGSVRVLYNMKRTSLTQDRVLTGRVDPDERTTLGDESRLLDENEVEEI